MENKTFRIHPQTIKKWNDLPFITCDNRGVSQWHIPEDDMSYGDACRLGAVYAVYFIQYLKDNSLAGGNMLIGIVKQVDFSDESESQGVRVGFFSTLEEFISADTENTNIWAWLEDHLTRSLRVEKRLALERIAENVNGELIEQFDTH